MNDILRRACEGTIAGIAATVTMSSFMAVAEKAGLLGDPPPHQITKRLMKKAGIKRSRDRSVPAAWALHFGIGASLGLLHAFLLDRQDQRAFVPSARYGAGVYATAYGALLPKLHLMPPPLFDRPGRQPVMWIAHMVFGATLAGVRRLQAAHS